MVRAMEEAPGGAPRRGRPPVLDRDRLITVAAGMDPRALTMTGVARELGVATSALYRWVSDREALLDLVSSTMLDRILPGQEPTASSWRAWLTTWAHNVRREFGAVPGFAARVLTGPHRDPAHGRLEAAGVHAFTAAGHPPDRARQCWYAFAVAVVGWVAVEHGHDDPAGEPRDFDALLEILLRGTAPG